MKKILSLVLMTALVMVTTIPMTGCNSSQVVSEVNVILNEATNILAVSAPNAPWLPQLRAAVGALQASEATWQKGGSVQLVIDGLNAVEAVTAVIPVTAVYSPLIDVLVAGIEAVLAALPPSTKMSTSRVANPHFGAATIPHHRFHSPSSDFKAKWNEAADQANLENAKL